jgi:DNA-binding NarL/FixJ family response regulator
MVDGTATTCPRVFISDDHPWVLDRIRDILSADYEVIGSAQDGKTLVAEVRRLEPDLVVLDISMPVLNGIAAARQLREGGSKARFVFVSMHEDPVVVRACLAEGASGFVIKHQLEPDLIMAVREALNGRTFVSPTLKSESAKRFQPAATPIVAEPRNHSSSGREKKASDPDFLEKTGT